MLVAVGALPPPVVGFSKAFELVARGLAARGWDVRVVDIADRSPDRLQGMFSLSRARHICGALARAIPLSAKADLLYITIAQSRWGFAKDLLILRWAALLRRPMVAHLHGGNFLNFYSSLSRTERFLVRRALDRIARVVVLTEGMKKDLAMMRDWERRTVVISNACEVGSGSVRRSRPGHLRVLYLSNLVVAKGYREVVTALDALARRRPDLRLHLAVAGAPQPERHFASADAQVADLSALLARLPRNATSRYHGVVEGAEKDRLLADADVFVLPTHYIHEAQPIAVLEALASGLPVVGSRWRGIPESLPPAMYPLLVPPRDANAMATTLERLCDDGALLERMSAAALAHGERFAPERHLSRFDVVLREALDEG